jgi:hypothetical protein
MAENRVKFIVEADSKGAITSFADFRKALDLTGASAKLTDAQLAQISDKFLDKLQADKAAAALRLAQQQIERLGTSAGLSERELAKLYRQLGVTPPNVSQSFASLQSGAAAAEASLTSLVAKVGTVVAAYISLREAAEFVSQSIMSAARYETLGVVIEKVGENAGYTKQEVFAFAEGVQKAGISMIESREAVAKMAAAQLDLSKASALARVAQDAAVISGTNSSDAFAKLVQGISTGQTILLHHQGIMVNLEVAYKKYAKQLGITKGELTEVEKREAALDAVLEEGQKRTGVYDAAMNTAGKQLQSFTRYVQDASTRFGEAFLGAFTGVVFDATESMKRLQDVIKDQETQETLSRLAEGAASFFKTIIEGAPGAAQGFIGFIKSLEDAWANTPPELKEFLKYGIPMAIGATVGRRFGPWGGLVGAGVGLYGAVKADQAIGGKEKLEKEIEETNDAMYGAESLSKRRILEAHLNQLIEEYTRLSEAANKAAEAVKKVAPGKEQADRANEYNAAWQKGAKEYEKSTSRYIALGENNTKYLPADQQLAAAKELFESRQAGIAKAWMLAWEKGRYDDAAALNRSMDAARGMYDDTVASINNKTKGADKAAGTLQQVIDRYQVLQEQLAGDTLGAKLASIDQKYDAFAARIGQAMKEAGADVAAYGQALDVLARNRALEKHLAQVEAWRRSMQAAAGLLTDLGRLSGDPGAIYAGAMTNNQLWQADQQKRINALADVSERAKQSAELQEAMDLKELEARRQAYAGMEAVSSRYWDAEREYLGRHLEVVRQNADSETAYRIYAAQQWDGYNKRLLENQAAHAGTFGDVVSAKWSLAFGTYRSELGKAHDNYSAFADSLIGLTDDMAGAIAGSFGDLLRGLADGTLKVEDLAKSLRSRMAQAIGNFFEENFKRQLRDALGGLGALFGGAPRPPSGSETAPRTLTTPHAAVEAAQATINIASGTVAGLPTVGAGGGDGGTWRDVPVTVPPAPSAFVPAAAVSSAVAAPTIPTTQNDTLVATIAGLAIPMGREAGGIISDAQMATVHAASQEITAAVTRGVDQSGTLQRTAQTVTEAQQKQIWYTHNNPGNLRIPGQAAYQQFGSMEDGLAAMYRQLMLDFTRGRDTVASIISKYAPPSENDTAKYIAMVSKSLGVGPNDKIDLRNGDTMEAMMRAMVQIETGVQAETVASRETYYAIAHQMQAQAKPIGVEAGTAAGQIVAEVLMGGGRVQLPGQDGQLRNPGTDWAGGIAPWAAGQGTVPSISEGLQTALQGYNWSTGTWDKYVSPLTAGDDVGWWRKWSGGSVFPNMSASSASSGTSSAGFDWQKGLGALGGVASGITGVIGSAAQGNVMGAIGSGLMAVGSVVSLIPGLNIVGGVLTLLGGVASLFGGDEKKKKQPVHALYEGTASVYADGTAMAIPMEYRSDGSVRSKTIQPQDINEVQKAFRDLVKSVRDAAKVLNIDLVKGINTNFSLATGLVSSELQKTQQWVMQDQYGKGALGDLAGAVQFFSDGMQNTIEIFTGLAEAAKTVKGRIEALGVDFTRLSGIDDMLLSTIANFATGTYAQMQDNATASLETLADSATSAAQYVAQYRDQLISLAEAEMSKLYQDAVGGSDAFNSAMDTYGKYAITTKEEKQSALAYYQDELSRLITKFKRDFSGVLVDFDSAKIDVSDISTFWGAYHAAMQQSMSPDMLASWAEMASYAKQIQDTATELDKLQAADDKWDSDLKYRRELVQGLATEADITKTLAGYEQELAQARENDMTYAQQADLVETQRAELQKKVNDLLGITVDATSSYDAALTELTRSVENQVAALSEVASTASSAESTFSSIANSLQGVIRSMQQDDYTNYALILASRQTEFDALYKKAMAGDKDAYSQLSESASAVLQSIKAGGVSAEQYDTAYWTLRNKVATAQAVATSKKDYQSVIADLSQQQVDILSEIKDELSQTSVDTTFVDLAASLERYADAILTAYDQYKASRLSDDEYMAQARSAESSLSTWILQLVSSSATIGEDQIRSIGGSNNLLQGIMSGQIQLSGLTQQQASVLGSALSVLQTISGITGTDLTYSDMAQYYLSRIADGVSITDWSGLTATMTDGKAAVVDAINDSIEEMAWRIDDLRKLQSQQTATTSAQSGYFESISNLLYKQTQVEVYASLLQQAKDTASGYMNYAMAAMMSGSIMGAIVGLQWMQQYNDMQGQITALQSQFDYWKSWMPSVALAGGAVVYGPTVALLGEGNEPEVVSPLSRLSAPSQGSTTVISFDALVDAVLEMGVKLDRIETNTYKTSRNTDNDDAFVRAQR